MEVKNITKGEWKDTNNSYYWVESDNSLIGKFKSVHDKDLFIEAGNVAQATGLSPLQLQQRGDELYRMLEDATEKLEDLGWTLTPRLYRSALEKYKHKTTTNDK